MPVRVEVGPRDLAEGNVTVVTRHTLTKQSLPLPGVVFEVGKILAAAGDELFAEALELRQSRTADAATLDEATTAAAEGFARIPMAVLGPEGEDRLAQHAVTVRCLQRSDGSLAVPGDADEDLVAVVARSY